MFVDTMVSNYVSGSKYSRPNLVFVGMRIAYSQCSLLFTSTVPANIAIISLTHVEDRVRVTHNHYAYAAPNAPTAQR